MLELVRGLVFRVIAVPALLLLPVVASAVASGSDLGHRYERQRTVFIELRQALADGNLSTAVARSKELEGYPLEYFFEYLLLRQRIKEHRSPAKYIAAVDRYQHRWGDKRLQRKLLGAIKSRMAGLEQWRAYTELLRHKNAPQHACDDLYAQLENKLISGFDATTAKLWAAPVTHSGRCRDAFETLTNHSAVPVQALWERSRALITRGMYSQAQALYRYFGRRDIKRLQDWIDARTQPAIALPRMQRAEDLLDRQIVEDLLNLWARQDLPAAFDYWQKHGKTHGFKQAQINKKLSSFAVRASKVDLPDAVRMLAAVDGTERDVRYWRVRSALRQADWQKTLDVLAQLNATEQRATRWRYWRARALQQLGFTGASENEFRKLAGKLEYYGFLAADQIGQPYQQLQVNRPQVSEALKKELLQQVEIWRAIEFHLVGVGWEGRRCWNIALVDATEGQLIAAAAIATSIGWTDRAMNAMKRADQPHALDTLFPTPYRAEIDVLTRQNSLQRELVYGVIRQESAFIADIRSPAGAIGLMQLMPATAKQMGRQLGVNAAQWRLIDSQLNIKLGVSYLRYVLDRFNHNTVLATAAYNAGPTRVKRWLGKSALSADIWVETIPFDETRDYVKNVLFNATVAQWRLDDGYTARLSSRMPDILPAS